MKKSFVRSLISASLCCLLWLSSVSFSPAIAIQLFPQQSPSQASSNPSGQLTEFDLASWDAEKREKIATFVTAVSTPGSGAYVEPEDRIAVFDNDGTLWAERPDYFQVDYIKNKIQSIDLPGKLESLSELSGAFDAMPIETYRNDVKAFLEQNKQSKEVDYPDYEGHYLDLVYQPMVELVDYLQRNDFSVFICSGGGIDFVRAFSEEAYGIPTQNVIGSSTSNYYKRNEQVVMRSGKDDITLGNIGDYGDQDYGDDGHGGGYPTPPEGLKTFAVNPFNDKEGKAIGIERYLGKKPIMAVGNSDGDYFMFDYTHSHPSLGTNNLQGGEEVKPLIVLLNHDDGCVSTFQDTCEYTYNSDVGKALANFNHDAGYPDQDFCLNDAGEIEYCSLARANDEENWLVVSMANDFSQIFFPNFKPCLPEEDGHFDCPA